MYIPPIQPNSVNSWSEQAASQSVRALMCRKISFDFYLTVHLLFVPWRSMYVQRAIAWDACTLLWRRESISALYYYLIATKAVHHIERQQQQLRKKKQIANAEHDANKGEFVHPSTNNTHWHSHDAISNDDYAVSSSATCPFRYQEVVQLAKKKLRFIREKDLKKKWDEEKRILQENKQYKIHDICLQIVRAAKCNVSEYVCIVWMWITERVENFNVLHIWYEALNYLSGGIWNWTKRMECARSLANNRNE